MKACIDPSGERMSSYDGKIIETVYKGQKPNLFDNWALTSIRLLIPKSFIVQHQKFSQLGVV